VAKKITVLVPLDESEFSRQILPQVEQFIAPAEGRVIFFRVAERVHGLTGGPKQPVSEYWLEQTYASHRSAELAKHPIYESQMEDNAVAIFESEFNDEIRSFRKLGYDVSVAVRFGEPAQKILDFVEEEDVDLVAMCTHGRTGPGRLFFGSVAEKVLHKISIPILLLRPVGQTSSAPRNNQTRMADR